MNTPRGSTGAASKAATVKLLYSTNSMSSYSTILGNSTVLLLEEKASTHETTRADEPASARPVFKHTTNHPIRKRRQTPNRRHLSTSTKPANPQNKSYSTIPPQSPAPQPVEVDRFRPGGKQFKNRCTVQYSSNLQQPQRPPGDINSNNALRRFFLANTVNRNTKLYCIRQVLTTSTSFTHHRTLYERCACLIFQCH